MKYQIKINQYKLWIKANLVTCWSRENKNDGQLIGNKQSQLNVLINAYDIK